MAWYIHVVIGIIGVLVGWRLTIVRRNNLRIEQRTKRERTELDKTYTIPRELDSAEAYWLAKHFELAGVTSTSHHPPHQREAMEMLKADHLRANDPYHVELPTPPAGPGASVPPARRSEPGDEWARMMIRALTVEDDTWKFVRIYEKLRREHPNHVMLPFYGPEYEKLSPWFAKR